MTATGYSQIMPPLPDPPVQTQTNPPAEPVVRAVEAKLGTDITQRYPLERLVIGHAPQLDKERVYPERLPFNDQLGHEDAVRGGFAEPSRPPLYCASEIRGVLHIASCDHSHRTRGLKMLFILKATRQADHLLRLLRIRRVPIILI